MVLSPTAKQAIDRCLELASTEENGIPGVVYAVMDKNAGLIYAGTAGVKSLKEPDVKVSVRLSTLPL